MRLRYPSLGTRCLPLLLGLALLLSFAASESACASKWDVTTVWAGKTTYTDGLSSTGTSEDIWNSDGSNTGKTVTLGFDSATVKAEGYGHSHLFSVQFLPQFLQRQRFVPERLVPNGITDSTF